jgi:DNA replication protein DnaC
MSTPRFEFQTFGDPVLVKMLNEATEYAASYKNGGGGWLSFVGSSGTGKTYLATQLCRHLGGTVKRWPKFMAKMRTGTYEVYDSVQYLANLDGVLMLDEIGVGNDAKTFGLDLLMQLLESRRTRPTLLTSNLTIGGLTQLDARITSRLFRHGKVLVCDTKDFAVRAK